ncbi:MAG TPA: hypothetical protein ENI51_08715 [Candidatus Atribacteria bacterium]|nr:hypothetical protein [Candidatus Atribacteria bacterium]
MDVSVEEMEEEKQKIKDLIELIEENNTFIFLGAGASKEAGLPTIKDLANLLKEELDNPSKLKEGEVSEFLKRIISILENKKQNSLTIEDILETIYHIYFLMTGSNNEILPSIKGVEKIDRNIMDLSITFIKKLVYENCIDIDQEKLNTHKCFFQCMLNSGRMRKFRVFTTNWDIIVEKVCDILEFKCEDGFTGIFDAFESFNILRENHSTILPTVFLYKLHGSLNWIHYGNNKIIRTVDKLERENYEKVMIYPTPFKFREILGYPYSDLLSFFSDSISRKSQSPLLIVIGYSLGDSHIISKISNMLKENERSNLFIINPNINFDSISKYLEINEGSHPKVKLINIDFNMFTRMLKEFG